MFDTLTEDLMDLRGYESAAESESYAPAAAACSSIICCCCCVSEETAASAE